MERLLRQNIFSEPRELTEAEAGYLAGLIDGEGTIGLYCAHVTNGRRSHAFKPALAISNTDIRIIERVLEITGNGRVTVVTTDDVSHKPCYKWALSPSQIGPILVAVLGHLKSKGKQAELLLRFLRLSVRNSRGSLTDEAYLAAAGICNELRHLNRRGLSIAEVEVTIGERKHPGDGAVLCLKEGCRAHRYRRGSGFCFAHWKEAKPQDIATCDYCGATYERLLPHGRFCSDTCQQNAYHRRVREPAVVAERQKNRRLCPGCSQWFSGGKKGKRYCSANCQSKHRRLILFAERNGLPKPALVATAKKARDLIIDRTCPQCGVIFQAPRGKRTYCTTACMRKASAARKPGS